MSEDPFDLLGVPPKAEQDVTELKNRFETLQKESHPDSAKAPDTKRYANLQQAYQTLSLPGKRLKALLIRVFGDQYDSRGPVPNSLMTLFSEISEVLMSADAFVAKKTKATTAIAQSLLTPELLKVQSQLGQAQQILQNSLDEAIVKLPDIDTLLETDRERALSEGSFLTRELLYLEKWQSQVRERFHRLL